jgi:hypothetical protein
MKAKPGCYCPIPDGELLSINEALVLYPDFKEMIIGTIHGEIATLNMGDSAGQDPLLEGCFDNVIFSAKSRVAGQPDTMAFDFEKN